MFLGVDKAILKISLSVLLLCGLMLPWQSVHALRCEASPGKDLAVTDGGDFNKAGHIQYYRPSFNTLNSGSTSITMNSAISGLAANDMVLIIQMQAAEINYSNSANYGANAGTGAGQLGTNFNAGYYEYAAVSSVSGSTLTLKAGVLRSYYQSAASSTMGQRRYQVIRVPQYSSLTLASNLTTKAWDGFTGGVLPIDVSGALNLSGRNIEMNAKGFRGGGGFNHLGSTALVVTPDIGQIVNGVLALVLMSNQDFRVNAFTNTVGANGSKGEGVAGTPRFTWDGTSSARTDNTDEGYPLGSYARGAPGNAGGGGTDGRPAGANPGGNDQNSGGGGGGNGGAGGIGGNSWSTNLPTGGRGGAAFPSSVSRLVMGGGGGAGTMNNNTAGTFGGPHGGRGGGMILIRAGSISGTGSITANGGLGITPLNDGAGGGGAGGSVLVIANSHSGSLSISVRGGNGGDSDHGDSHGPGGGGGGGVAYTNSVVSASITATQGASGQTGNPREYFGASPLGGSSGSGTNNAPASGVPGVSAGADCLTYKSDLSIEKSRNSGSMQVGGTAQFLIKVNNLGPDAIRTSTVVTDVLEEEFAYTGYSGTNWTCVQDPVRTIRCTNSTNLAVGALPNLLINTTIANNVTNQAVSNTATVALTIGNSNSDPVNSNNQSTINDIIYGAPVSGTKWLYVYPQGSARKLSRVVPPSSNELQNISRGTSYDHQLNPTLTGNLAINGNVMVRLCLKPGETSNQDQRRVDVSLWRKTGAAAAVQIGATASQYFSNHNWQQYIFQLDQAGTTTVNSATELFLRINNNSAGSNTRTVDVSSNGANSDCVGSGPSRVEVETTTVINVNSVAVYNAPHPSGQIVSRLVQGSTVYVRSTVTDPFGHGDINNDSVVHLLSGATVVAGPFPQTKVISEATNTKQFEYAVAVPAAPAVGIHNARVTANEGTEGVISHRATTAFEITSQPALMVTKVSSRTTAMPGEEITYTAIIANTHVLSTGDAYNVVVSDKLPAFTSLKLQAPIVAFANSAAPLVSSGLTMGTVEYSNDNGVTWLYAPVSGGGGAPAGFDANVTHFRIPFTGVMPPNGGFQLTYTLRLN